MECRYCGDPAETVDHIVPWSYGGRDDEDNLTAACAICNVLAANKVFDTFEEKRRSVLQRRESYIAKKARSLRKALSICPDCDAIFIPRVDGATAVLCASCMKADEDGVHGSLLEERAEYAV
jgi:hypothetical protein